MILLLIALLLCGLPLHAQGLLVRGAGGGPTFCGAISQTNLVSCWGFKDGSGQTLTDLVGSNDGQLGSTAGSDTEDPDWVTAGLSFDSADPNYVTFSNFYNPTSALTVCAILQYDDTGSAQDLFTQQDGTGTGEAWLRTGGGDNLASTLGHAAWGTTATMTNGSWYVGCFSHNTTSGYLKINDNSENNTSISPVASNGDHILGVWKDLSTRPMDHVIAGLFFYNAFLTQATRDSNYTAIAADAELASRGISF